MRRIRLFADSNSDWLDEVWSIDVFVSFLDAIRLAPNVDFQLLTKRIDGWKQRLELAIQNTSGPLHDWIQDWLDGNPPTNVWLGASLESPRQSWRVGLLQAIPANKRFLSVEPLLESVDLSQALHGKNAMDWIIVGGESGPKAIRRDCGVEAIVSVAEQCLEAGVPVYVKQDEAFKSGEQGRIPAHIWRLKQFPRSVEKAASKLR